MQVEETKLRATQIKFKIHLLENRAAKLEKVCLAIANHPVCRPGRRFALVFIPPWRFQKT